MPSVSKNLDSLCRSCIHPITAVLEVPGVPNLAGWLLLSIQTHSRSFWTIPSIFKKMFIFVHFVHSEHQEPGRGSILALGHSYYLYLPCRTTGWSCNAWIGPKMSMCQKRAECLQKSGFIVPILHTPYNRCFRCPRCPIVCRVALVINTNQSQVILGYSQHFYEIVYFCSFCSSWAPGVKQSIYFCL